MDRMHVKVTGMANSQMKNSLKNTLDKLEGVQMVNIDLARGTVEVGFNSPANEIQIKNSIENTGFKLL